MLVMIIMMISKSNVARSLEVAGGYLPNNAILKRPREPDTGKKKKSNNSEEDIGLLCVAPSNETPGYVHDVKWTHKHENTRRSLARTDPFSSPIDDDDDDVAKEKSPNKSRSHIVVYCPSSVVPSSRSNKR